MVFVRRKSRYYKMKLSYTFLQQRWTRKPYWMNLKQINSKRIMDNFSYDALLFLFHRHDPIDTCLWIC